MTKTSDYPSKHPTEKAREEAAELRDAAKQKDHAKVADAYTLELEATIRKLQSALTAQPIPVVPADDKATIRAVAQAIHMYHPISGGCADGACARAVIGALNAK